MRAILLIPLTGALLACSRAVPPTVAVAPSAACLAGQETMIRDALVFGLSIPGGGMVSDAQWEAFLAERVTPAFPSGFTVLPAEGQWRETTGTIAKEPSRMVIVMHPLSAEADASLEGIKREYLRRFSQEAVLWERTTACVGF